MKSNRTRATLAVTSAAVVVGVSVIGGGAGAAATTPPTAPTIQCAPAAAYPAATTPVGFWSTESRCAIVPPGPGGAFGSENFGTKFPGEAAVYMGIAHVAIYDAAVSIWGGYQSYATTPVAPAGTSPDAVIATAAYDTSPACSPSSVPARRSSTRTTPPTWPPCRTGRRRLTASR